MSALKISSNLHRCHVRGSRVSGHSPTGEFSRPKKMRDSLVGTMKRGPALNSRRMLLYGFLGILCIVRTIESAPLDSSSDFTRHESTGTLASGLPSKKGQEEEVGNPSELAWQAWLLVDGHPGSQASGVMDSASLLRRITPKSIFIAPALTDCPEGYQDDTMNRCVKDVNIDHQAHMGFLVERLKAIYANVGKPQVSASSSSSSSSIPTGPLQLNIPLLLTAPSKAPIEPEEPKIQEAQKAPPTVEPLKIIAGEESADSSSSDRHREAIVTVYELNEDTREDESTFFLGNKSTEAVDKNDKSPEKRPGLVLPVGEFVDEPSEKLSGVVDYRIPVTVEKIVNVTSSNVGEHDEAPNGMDAVKESEVSPTLVLLLSPTKVPSISLPGSDHIVAHNSSLGQVIIKMENVTGNLTGKEIIRVSVPDDLSSSSTAEIRADDEDEDSTTDSRTDGDLVSGEDKENDGEEEEEATTEAYAEEAYEESTEIEDEILTHSEAGMTVTMAGSVKPVTAETPSENDDNETTGSSEISSEVSINGDFVRETTLVDFNVSGGSNSTTGTTSSRIEETSTSVPLDPSGFEFVEAAPEGSVDPGDEKRNGQTPKTEDESSTLKDNEKMFETELKEKMEVEPEVVYSVSSIEDLFEQEMKSEASSTERSTSAETMIAASTNDAGPVISREPPKFELASSPAGKKRGQPFRFSEAASTTTKIPSAFPNVEGVYDYEPVPRDYPRRPSNGFPEDLSLPVIHTIDEQRYRPEPEDDENFFPTQQDYVRFPSYDRHGRPNYVRFPSEETNSIHNPNDYKDRNRRPYGQQYQAPNYSRGSQATKTLPGQEIRQKQSYWWVPPGWRTDRQQQQITPQRSRSDSVEQRPRDRAPMLLRFWTRMPLVRDPSLNYQQHPTYPTFGAHSRSSSTSSSSHGPSRRVNYYKEMSTQDLSRAFSRQTLPSAIGG